jgi:hypothetical protein
MILKNDGTIIQSPPQNSEKTLKQLSKFWKFTTKEDYEKEQQKIIMLEKEWYTGFRGKAMTSAAHPGC